MSNPRKTTASALIMAFLVSGCGTYVPQIQEAWEGTEPLSRLSAGGTLEYHVKKKVYCGIVDAVIASRNRKLLPPGWAVQVTLDLQVDETGALNPGVSLIKPLEAMQTFTLGLGGTVSSQGTREDKFGTYWALDRLKSYINTDCDPSEPPDQGSSLLLVNDLGIKEWLIDALSIEKATPASAFSKETDSAFKQQFLSYHIKFVVISNASIAPTWKLTRIGTGYGSLPLASINRTRTHDLLITFGPEFKPGSPNIAVSSHAAQDFGISVNNGGRYNGYPLPF